MGIVYYAHYLVWFEVARTDLLRSLGWSYKEMEIEGFFLPVIEASCEYKYPTRYDDDVEIRTVGILRSSARLEFRYDVVRDRDQVVAAVGRTVHASVNAEGRPCRLPERIRTLFRQ